MRRIKLPVHIAFIMDGNGRWAKRRFRPRAFGHRAGVQNMTKICTHAFKLGVRIVTVYALSTENLSRPKEELDELFDLIRTYFGKKRDKLLEMQVKINVLGDISVLPEDVQRDILEVTEETALYSEGLFNICINYGARQEIVRAVNAAVSYGRFVDEASFKDLLSTSGVPIPTLSYARGERCAYPTSSCIRRLIPSCIFPKKCGRNFLREISSVPWKTIPRATGATGT